MSKRIKTFNDIKNGENDSGEESGGEGQSFFVGGSEHSGQQVLGPDRRDFREQLFNAARQAGAEALPATEAAISGKKPSRFPGGGMKLGGPGASDAPAAETVEENAEPETVIVRIFFYKNGFTIEDGPFRLFEENVEFMDAVQKGQVPAELYLAYPRKKIHVHMEKKHEPYEAPKVQSKPFMGTGARLGAIVPELSSTSEVAPARTAEQTANSFAEAQREVNLDESAPITQVQIRFENGERVVAKFNHNHTIQQLRNFVVTANPALAFAPFNFMQTFPRTIIEDETLTISDAGLLNSVVIVKSTA